MKKIYILPMLLIVAAALTFTSCGSGHVYYSQPVPRYHAQLSLIIVPSPGFRVDRYRDGRYYYRSPEGYMYWRGYDNRFYLDRAYLNRGHYNHREYNDWNRYRKNYHRRRY